MRLLLISLSLLLAIPNFFHTTLETKPLYDHKEKFDPSLSAIDNVEKLIDVADREAVKKGITQGSLQYGVHVAILLRNRFYHGFSLYPMNENWIATTAQRIFGSGLASIVNPDDILKYSYGGCSQQTIVLMEVMKRKNIPYRSVGFPHHYASELNFGGNWFFFDPNMEPTISDSQRIESNWKKSVDSLKKYYDTSRFKDLDWKFGKNLQVKIGKENVQPAPKAMLFQNISRVLSKTIWIIPLMLAFKKRRKIYNKDVSL